MRLRSLWESGQPISDSARRITDHIGRLSVCNWALEGMVLAICSAIATGEAYNSDLWPCREHH